MWLAPKHGGYFLPLDFSILATSVEGRTPKTLQTLNRVGIVREFLLRSRRLI